MPGRRRTSRQWMQVFGTGTVRLRCSYQRLGKYIEKFVAQLEVWHQGNWIAVVRYDNAHGFCHRDVLQPDGTQEKTRIFVGDNNTTFTHAIDDLTTHWQSYCDRFLGGGQP